MKDHKISIIVDSGSDMLPEEGRRLGIRVLPLKVRFGDEEFDDGVTISRDAFYNRLVESDVVPKTSQISPYDYEEAFREEVEKGNEVVCLTLSSKMSGCFQSANIAAANFEGKVFVVDTLQFCGPEYLLAERAAGMRDAGLGAAEIAAAIQKERLQPRVIALFDTLTYAYLGGRVSAAAAGIGNMLSIKPVVTIENGEVSVIGKARGSKNGSNQLIRFIQKHHGIDWDKPLLLSYSGNSDHLLEKYVEDSAVLYKGHDSASLPRCRVGATIGTYAGPGCVAFSFYPKEEGIG